MTESEALKTDAPAIGAAQPLKLVVAAASAGGLTALSTVLGGLPGDFPAPILVVQHLDPRHRSLMAEILARRTALHVLEATDRANVVPSTVYIAPPDHHLLVGVDGVMMLSRAELVHFVRPSADLLFESAAGAFGTGVVGVVLSGTGGDATMGVRAIDEAGGIVIAQDPVTAEFSGMPQAAVDTGVVDFVLNLDLIAPKLVALIMGGPPT